MYRLLTFLLGSQMAEIEHFCAQAQKMAQEGKGCQGGMWLLGHFLAVQISVGVQFVQIAVAGVQ